MANTTLKGEVIAVLELKQGTSKAGKDWQTQSYAIKETEEKYPKIVAFDIFGEEKIKEANLKVGDIVSVEANVESREWNGRYFTSISAWRVEKEGGVQETPQAPQEEETKGDLPF